MKKILITLFMFVSAPAIQAADSIDLRCEELAAKMVSRLADEGLLASAEQHQPRARKISVELCTEVQQSAQLQHEVAKQNALKNWIFEEAPDKAGNRRLKKLK